MLTSIAVVVIRLDFNIVHKFEKIFLTVGQRSRRVYAYRSTPPSQLLGLFICSDTIRTAMNMRIARSALELVVVSY